MDLSVLNERQKQAVTVPFGPVLVLAGAGSGKTRALTYRIAFLCEKKMVSPDNMLALTFTNKAAKEMSQRVAALLAGPAGSGPVTAIPHMGTFHSVCAKLLRQEIHTLGYTRGFAIYDSDDQAKVVKEIIQDLHIDKRFSPSLFRSFISSAKNVLQLPGEFSIGLEADLHNLVQQVYSRYQDYLYRQNAVDFDDLLMLTVKIFQNFPDILEKYQKLFQYVLVDEYQDTNHAQYVFLYLLAERHHNLFVVGDDAQSIYGFRGSTIRNILNFEQDFPETVVIKLEQNYRSTKNILAVAQKVIELNPEQKPKILWTDNPDGKSVEVRELEDETDEAAFVADTVISLSSPSAGDNELEYVSEDEPHQPVFSILDQFLKKRGRSLGPNTAMFGRKQLPKDHGSLDRYAVLFRTHAQSRALEEVFIESGIPYRIVGGLRFYERKEIKDVIAYVRLAVNYRDLLSLRRVINEPARGIGEKSYAVIREKIMSQSVSAARAERSSAAAAAEDPARLLADFRACLKEVKFGPKIGAAVDGFFELVAVLSSLAPEEDLASLMRLVIQRSGYEAWVRDGTDAGEARWENVQELCTVAEKFSGKPWREGAQQFLEEVALITEIEEAGDNAQADAVTMMTLHSAKGLEFDVVFLVGLEEGILPHSRSLLSPSELSEEVRLAYVGLTRARQQLFLTFARHRASFGGFSHNQPSRILRALPRDRVTYRGPSFSGFSEDHFSGPHEEDSPF